MSANREQIEALASSNPAVRQAMGLCRYGRCTYQESLEILVIHLAGANAALTDALVGKATLSPAPIFIREPRP